MFYRASQHHLSMHAKYFGGTNSPTWCCWDHLDCSRVLVSLLLLDDWYSHNVRSFAGPAICISPPFCTLLSMRLIECPTLYQTDNISSSRIQDQHPSVLVGLIGYRYPFIHIKPCPCFVLRSGRYAFPKLRRQKLSAPHAVHVSTAHGRVLPPSLVLNKRFRHSSQTSLQDRSLSGWMSGDPQLVFWEESLHQSGQCFIHSTCAR